MEYENKILDAIEVIVDNKINNANFDKTILATIIKSVDSTLGQYIVKYQDSNFYAYSDNINVTFAKGSKVYVLIPNNDWTRQKTILGSVDQLSDNYIASVETGKIFEAIGNNCITIQNEYNLCSYEDTVEKVLYEKDGEYNALELDIQGLETYLKNAESIKLSAQIKTNLPIEQRFRGNYGIVYELAFYDNGTEDEVIRSYVLDINQFESNPYKLFNYKKQNGIFDIDGQNFKYINKIYLFCLGFPNQEVGHEADIFIKDLEIGGGHVLSQTELDSYGMKLVTPQGIYFDENDLSSSIRTIQAFVRVKDKYINPEAQKLSYYWFVEDNSITSSSEKYHSYGGQGWRCLNDSTTVQSATIVNDAVVEWVPMDYQLTVKKQDVAAKRTSYKCVAIYNNNILSQTVTIINYDSNYEITIESDNGTQFYYDIGNPNLTCKINEIEQTGNDYTYAWAKIDNNNNFFGLAETTTLNEEYIDLISDYEDLLDEIADETAMPAASQSQLEEYQEEIKEYENITRIEKNKIHHLLVKEIVAFATYKCSVYYQGIYIGTAAIKILNDVGKEEQYTLIINDGTQTFKYNEAGIAPTNKSLENPQKIPSLSFSIYDPNGEALSNTVLSNCDITWKIPSENTFITHEYTNDIVTNQLELFYGIKDNYNINYINNDIELIVKYKDLILTTKTNLTFLKEGENGANGTDFVCKIVPNTNEEIDYPMICNGNLNFTPSVTAKWFRVQLWHNGDKIFDNYASGNSTENKYTTVQWSVLKNKYTTTISDPTNIIISADGDFSYSEYSGDGASADIVKATVIYNGIKYFTTIPVLVATAETGYEIKLVKNSGFQYVFYNADGRYPQYVTSPFELQIFKTINGIKEDISNLSQNSYRVNYTWNVKGQVYDPIAENWVNQSNLELVNNLNLKRSQKEYKPIDTYNGECLSTALVCSITNTSNAEVAAIHIPIHLLLNRYGNAALNEWDGNHISIDKNDNGVILAPQIGAGKKENDNSFTGIFMGSVKEVGSNETEVGLFGYSFGTRTIELNSKDGSAKFGKTGAGQIIMDPSSDTAVLRSGNFEIDKIQVSGKYAANRVYYKKIGNNYTQLIEGTDYEIGDTIIENNVYMWSSGDGLEIDLTDPHITFGSGNFWVDKNGKVHATGFVTTEELQEAVDQIANDIISFTPLYYLASLIQTQDTAFIENKNYYYYDEDNDIYLNYDGDRSGDPREVYIGYIPYHLYEDSPIPSKPTIVVTSESREPDQWSLVFPNYVENYTYYSCNQYYIAGSPSYYSWSDVIKNESLNIGLDRIEEVSSTSIEMGTLYTVTNQYDVIPETPDIKHAPEWEANTYYKLLSGVYELLNSKPEDWEINYPNYYYLDYYTYEPVQGINLFEWTSIAPELEPGKFLWSCQKVGGLNQIGITYTEPLLMTSQKVDKIYTQYIMVFEYRLTEDTTVEKSEYFWYNNSIGEYELYNISPYDNPKQLGLYEHVEGSEQPSDSDIGWTNFKPTWQNGYYLWVRTATSYFGSEQLFYSGHYQDTSWDTTNILNTNLNAARDILNGFTDGKSTVTINKDSIFITKYNNEATEPISRLVLNSSGIGWQLYDNDNNDWGEISSVWTTDGEFDAQSIIVKNLNADSIVNGSLQIGKDKNTSVLEIYNSTGQLVAKVSGTNGIQVYKPGTDFVHTVINPNTGIIGNSQDVNNPITYKHSDTDFIMNNAKVVNTMVIGSTMMQAVNDNSHNGIAFVPFTGINSI